MNYWFVDIANVSECFSPLTDWVESIQPLRREATQARFPGVRGWTLQGGTDIYGYSRWKWMKATAAWIAQNLWDHYAFTEDREHLEQIYPILKELSEFWVDSLRVEADGTVVAPESWSPERGPVEDGVAHEQQLVWDLFGNYVQASTILDRDPEFRREIAALRGKLLGPQIGSWGQIQEWRTDRDVKRDSHRHLSHMMAVHPCNQISPLTTPRLSEAAKVSMIARGEGGTGWSLAQKICVWARLHDGNRSYRLLNKFLNLERSSKLRMSGGGVYSNLFCAHPPFQIDGNFGYAAGICEMLLQSHMGEIHLLPALPDAWPTGHVKGIKARGNVLVDLEWKGGRLSEASIRSHSGGACTLRADVPFTIKSGDKVLKATQDPKLAQYFITTVQTVAGQDYQITAGGN